MSRRDIILVAVMINVGLLVVLFVTSLKSGKETTVALNESVPKKVEIAKAASPTTSTGADQIDQVLNHFSAKVNEKKKGQQQAPVMTPATQAEAAGPTARTVTVEKGDVLEKIARFNNVTVEEIMSSNRLKDSRLTIGQVLNLPSPKILNKDGKEAKYYIVKSGDNPWTIAHKHNIQLTELLRLNNMNKDKARKLRPGDKLRIQ